MKAVVTGAGVRLGKAIALALADAGFDIVVHYGRSEAPARAVGAEVEAKGRRALLVQADLAEPEQCARLVAEVSATWGPVDLLVNNAADYQAVPFGDITVQAWDRMQAINTRAPYLLTQGLLPGLRGSALPGGGLVINICDIGGERPVPGFAHYSVSKAGLIMLTRALALELAPQVRVNGISPGTVLAPEHLSQAQLAAIQQTIPAGRLGAASDVAAAAVFLASSAPYVTGQVLAVDGGRSIGGPMVAG